MTTATKNSLRTAFVLIAFTAVGTGLLAYTFDITKNNIAKNEEQAKRELIDQALPKSLYDNDIVNDVVMLSPTPELGTTRLQTLIARAYMAHPRPWCWKLSPPMAIVARSTC